MLADEVRRTARKGAHAVTFSENPSKLGWPSIHSDHWDPFWQACSDEQVVVCMHIGSSSSLVITSPDAPIDCLITLTPINIVQAAADLIWSPLFRKFPDLKVALSEGGIGWIPYFLERIDYQYRQHRFWTGQDFGDRLPSEVFNEQVLTCFIDDRFGVANRQYLNMDNVMWECDYPHSDSTWPFAPEQVWEHFDGDISDHDIDRMTHAQRDAPLLLRSVRRPRRSRDVHRGRTAGAGCRPRRVDQVGAPGHGRQARRPGRRPRRPRPLTHAELGAVWGGNPPESAPSWNRSYVAHERVVATTARAPSRPSSQTSTRPRPACTVARATAGPTRTGRR